MRNICIALAILQVLLAFALARYAIGTAMVGAHFQIRVTEASDPIIRKSLESVIDPSARAQKEEEMKAVVKAVGSVSNEGHQEMFGVGVALIVIAAIQFGVGIVFLAIEIGRGSKRPETNCG